VTESTPAGRTSAAATGITGAARRVTGVEERRTRTAADGATAGAASRSAPRSTSRRARLVVSRVSPWSVVKVTFLYSLCLFVILLVAVGVLWSVLNAAGVFDSVKSTAEDLTSKPNGGVAEWLSFSRVMLIATLVGLANIILVTVLSAIGSLLYNVCTDIVGGVEVTLSERG
jgi:Transmembrane domain of unknown function (DUF3566)